MPACQVVKESSVQVTWSLEEAKLSINILEFRTLWLSFHYWTPQLWDHQTRIQLANTTDVAYIHYQVDTISCIVKKQI